MARTMICTFMILTLAATVSAQQPATTTSQKTLASTLNIYAFPQKGQSASAQSKAEAECYQWAVQNTGSDPFQLQQQAQQQAAQTEANKQAAQQAGGNTVAKQAVKGAAVGTLIGGISGNEGKGAAYGAAAGVIQGSRQKKSQQAQASQQAAAQGQQVQQATAAQMDNFKKAFSVCLEGKGYLVKY